MFPANAASTAAAPHPTYASHNAAAASKSAYNHAADEASAKFGQPVGYTRPVGQPATFTQFSKPVSAAPAVADTRPPAANVAAYGAPQPPANAARGYPASAAPAQYSHGGAAAATSAQYAQSPTSRPANATYPAYGAPAKAGAAYGGPANAAAPVYQNVALGQSAQATTAGPPYANRSHLQSPLNGGRPNATTNAQMLPPAGKQYAAAHGYGYPAAGPDREQYAPQAVAGQQHGGSNRSYEMNGHQAGPGGHPGQGYGSQYSSVPPQMSSRYPGVSAIHCRN